MADLNELHKQYVRQAQWFYGVRSQLLRKAGIGTKRAVLELGCGTGAVTPELARRCGGTVTAVDIHGDMFDVAPRSFEGARTVVADGARLPFHDDAFDLVFTQMFFLWVRDINGILREVRRVLQPGSELIIAAEPDYGGCLAHPPETNPGPLLSEGLLKLGANPYVARTLPAALRAAGFDVEIGVHPSLRQSEELKASWAEEVAFIRSLGLEVSRLGQPPTFLFIPYFWFLAQA